MAPVFGDVSDREPSTFIVYGGSSTPRPSAIISFVSERDPARTSTMPATAASLRVVENTYPVSSDLIPSSSAFNKLSTLIPDKNKLRFSTAVDLANDIELKIEECLGSETGCYMLVTGVAEDMVEPLEEEMEELCIRKKARFTYEQTMQSLIVRLMPGASHNHVSWSLRYNIQNKVSDTPGHSRSSLVPVGATMFHVPGRRSKQGDAGLGPRDTQTREDQCPSVMIEVGYSESLSALRCDSEWWLMNSRGQTRMVIVVKICKHPNSLRLECWEMMVDPYRRVTRNRTPWSPGCNQHFEIDNAGTVTPPGRDLVIRHCTVFGPSQPGGPDVIFSAGELSQWALGIYACFL